MAAPKWKSDLKVFLDKVEPLGTFAESGPMTLVPVLQPLIRVEGVGLLGLPLMDIALEPLKGAASQASNSEKDSTCKEWQFWPDNATLCGGSTWNDYLQNRVVRNACRELGMSYNRVKSLGARAQFRKLLLCESGGLFPFQGGEEESRKGGFATLVIQLPSAFSGGELAVSRQGEIKTFDLALDSGSTLKDFAFFNDCACQSKPVTGGVRLCLVFDLVCQEGATLPSHEDNMRLESTLRSFAEGWMADDHPEAFDRLGYGLNHDYQPEDFDIDLLEGQDDHVWQTLLNAKSSSGDKLFNAYLLLMEHYTEAVYNDTKCDKMSARLVYNRNGEKVDGDWKMFKDYDSESEWWIGWRDYRCKFGKCENYNDPESESDYKEEWLTHGGGRYRTFGYQSDRTGRKYDIDQTWYYKSAIIISPYDLSKYEK